MLSALSKHNPTIDAGQYPQGPYMQYSLIDSFLAYEQKGLRADTLSAAKHYAVVARWGAVAGQWERRRVAPEPERQCFRRRRRPRWLC
ncbi:uncharacterized protein [Oryza sativa Japonica Group]